MYVLHFSTKLTVQTPTDAPVSHAPTTTIDATSTETVTVVESPTSRPGSGGNGGFGNGGNGGNNGGGACQPVTVTVTDTMTVVSPLHPNQFTTLTR